MENLHGIDPGVAAATADAFNHASNLPIEKFLILFLMLFCGVLAWVLLRFMDKRVDRFEELIIKMNDAADHFETKATKKIDEHLDALNQFQRAFQNEAILEKGKHLDLKFEIKCQIEEYKTKVAECKSAIAEYGEGSAVVLKLVMEYREEFKQIKANVDKFILILKEKKDKTD